jgi:hypothetical protein
LQDKRISVVEVRLLLEELVQVKLLSVLIPFPGRSTIYTPLQQ